MKKVLFLFLLMLPCSTFSQAVRDFTDNDYKKMLESESLVLFYSLSPSMQLSIEGIKEIRLAAAALKASLVLLADPNAKPDEIAVIDQPQVRYQKSSRLRDAGIQLHYPSVIVVRKRQVAGTPIAGFKSGSGYLTLVSDLLKLRWKEEFRVAASFVPPNRMNAFFKPVYGTDLIVTGRFPPASDLYNLRTKQTYPIGGYGDPGPTPDREFITLLTGTGLYWYSTADILAGSGKLLTLDPGLRTYQSVGQLAPLHYRVVGAVSSSTNPTGLIMREYKAQTRSLNRNASITAQGEWRRVCEGKRISIPMLSKTGHLLSGSHNGTLRVFRLGPDATTCDETFDTGVITGKADFNRDDSALVYVTRSANPATSVMTDTVVLADLLTKTRKPIYYAAPTEQLAFPSFMNADAIVVYEENSRTVLTLERSRVFE